MIPFSERDALRFVPVRDVDVDAVIEMRHLKRSLTQYKEALEQLPDCDPEEDSVLALNGFMSIPFMITIHHSFILPPSAGLGWIWVGRTGSEQVWG